MIINIRYYHNYPIKKKPEKPEGTRPLRRPKMFIFLNKILFNFKKFHKNSQNFYTESPRYTLIYLHVLFDHI